MIRWLLAIAAVAYALGVWTGTALAADCVALQVRPSVLLRSGDVDVQLRIARHAHHRHATVAWDSDVGAGGSRYFGLDGAHDRVLFQWWNRNQPAGTYEFVAVVYDARADVLGIARAHIRSVEREAP